MIPLISNIYTYKEKLILSLKGISPYFSSHLKNYQKIKKNVIPQTCKFKIQLVSVEA